MSDQVYQLTQMPCNSCGMGGIMPRTDTYVDRYTNEKITEATWVCHRCGSRFYSGIIAREQSNENQ